MQTVGILMLLEGVVASAPPRYRFDRLCAVLHGWRGFGFRYVVDTVRYSDDEPELERRFAALADGRYAQLWLIGTGQEVDEGRVIGKRLAPAHRETIEAFMRRGGGVFATGDHAGVGATLCSTIARVRRMRSWSGPPSEGGPDRIDTQVASAWPQRRGRIVRQGTGGGPLVNLNAMDLRVVHPLDEDDAMKTVWPTLVGGRPHPLMQIATGGDWPPAAIRFLPDHGHEGECWEHVSDDALHDEFQGVAPMVVAWGAATGHDAPSAGRPRVYGAVACHEPVDAGLGRVVVDSTFHHLTDENTELPRLTPAWYHVEQYVLNAAAWLTAAQAGDAARAFLARNGAALPDAGLKATVASNGWRRAVELAAEARIPRDLLPDLLGLHTTTAPATRIA